MFEIDLLIECRDNYDFLSGRQRARIDYIVDRYEKAHKGLEEVSEKIRHASGEEWERLERMYLWYVGEIAECVNMADAFRKECGWFETIAYMNLRPVIGVINA